MENKAKIRNFEDQYPTQCKSPVCNCWQTVRQFARTNQKMGEALESLNQQLMSAQEIITKLSSYQDHTEFRFKEIQVGKLKGIWPILLCKSCKGAVVKCCPPMDENAQIKIDAAGVIPIDELTEDDVERMYQDEYERFREEGP